MRHWKTISELDEESEPFVLMMTWAGQCRLLPTDEAKCAKMAICWYYPIAKPPHMERIILEGETNE